MRLSLTRTFATAQSLPTSGPRSISQSPGWESYFYTGWRPELVDLLVIAAAVEYCDLSVKRPAWGWARFFDLRVAVHSLNRWEDPAVHNALEDALSFLTGDQWIVSFVQRMRDIERVGQGSLGFDVRDPRDHAV